MLLEHLSLIDDCIDFAFDSYVDCILPCWSLGWIFSFRVILGRFPLIYLFIVYGVIILWYGYEDHFDYFYFRDFIEFMFFSVFSNSLFKTGKLTVIYFQRGTTKVFKNPTSPSQNATIPLNFKNSVTSTLFLASSLVC